MSRLNPKSLNKSYYETKNNTETYDKILCEIYKYINHIDLIEWTVHNKNLWFEWIDTEIILRFNYKSIPVFAVKQSKFTDFLKIILSQNSELETILNTFDMITFNDWLNQSEIVITEKHRTGIRRKDNILYTSFRLDKFEDYIKNISFSSFETDNIEQYNEKHNSQFTSDEYSNNHNVNHISNNNWSDYDEESDSEINNKYEDFNNSINDKIENEIEEELKSGDLIFEQHVEPEIVNDGFLNYNNDDIPIIHTEDIIMKDKTPEIDKEKETLNIVKQMFNNIKDMQQELKENNQTICEKRNKTTIKRNNNRLTKNIMDKIQLVQETSYEFYEDIIKENKWIQDAYKYYQNNNENIDTKLINIIVQFDVILENLNIDINKQKYKQKIKKNNRKRKPETKLHNKRFKRRKKQDDY